MEEEDKCVVYTCNVRRKKTTQKICIPPKKKPKKICIFLIPVLVCILVVLLYLQDILKLARCLSTPVLSFA